MPKQANRPRKVAPEEISSLCEQLQLMLSAGMPLHEGVEALGEDFMGTRDEAQYRVLVETLNQTGSLSQALDAAGLFPPYMIQMTAIGEKTGRLEEVMKGLTEYYLRESRIRRSVVAAVTYPLVLCVMMVCVIAVLVVRVLPVFDRVLSGMGIEMSGSLMQFGTSTGWIVLIAMGVVTLSVLAICLLLRTRWRERVMQALRRIFPPVRRLNERLSAARISSVMAMMVSSGYPMEEALDLMPSVLGDGYARSRVDAMRGEMVQGTLFPDALEHTGLFDKLHTRMIRMGYLTGQTESVMERVAGIYEEEVDEGIGSLIAVIEPSLVALLSIVIGAILLSVMLPMTSIIVGIL